jgi:hypothetical protein
MGHNKEKIRIPPLFRIILGFCLSSMLISAAQAQSIPHFNITGTIHDIDTGKPLPYTNVFLANTTLGSAADPNGYFRIEHIPIGRYELVASHIGYEISVVSIRGQEGQNRLLHISLTPKVLQGDTVRVTALNPRKWKKALKKFKSLFFGNTRNASMCQILNPEVLNFQWDETKGEFSASSEHPILIDNKGLGYHIQCYLIDFENSRDSFLRYKILPKYNHMQSKSSFQNKKWQKERRDAYYGSTRHFLTSLFEDHITEQGFEIYHHNNLILNSLGKIVFNKDYAQETNRDSLLKPGPLLSQKILSFSNYLVVKYHYKTSLLKMEKPSVLIDIFGHLYDSYAIKKFGHWTKLRFADTLPIDYFPDKRSR